MAITIRIVVMETDPLDGATPLPADLAPFRVEDAVLGMVKITLPVGLNFGRFDPGQLLGGQTGSFVVSHFSLSSAGGAHALGSTVQIRPPALPDATFGPSRTVVDFGEPGADLADGVLPEGLLPPVPPGHELLFDTTADGAGTGPHVIQLSMIPARIDPAQPQRRIGGESGITPGEDKWKDPVRLATAAALPANTATGGQVLTADANGAMPAIDAVAPALNDRVLVKTEGGGTDAKNGLYVVTDLGSGATPWVMTRSADAQTGTELCAGSAVISTEGSANADKVWELATNDPIVVGTTALTFIGPPTLVVEEEGVVVSANVDLIDFVGPTLTATTPAAGEIAVTQTTGVPVDVTKAANAEGVATSVARSDHKHDAATAVAVATGTANAEGASTSLSRADHVHELIVGATTGAPGAGSTAGEVRFDSATGILYIWNGAAWVSTTLT